VLVFRLGIEGFANSKAQVLTTMVSSALAAALPAACGCTRRPLATGGRMGAWYCDALHTLRPAVGAEMQTPDGCACDVHQAGQPLLRDMLQHKAVLLAQE
jgi:hypothetical protein